MGFFLSILCQKLPPQLPQMAVSSTRNQHQISWSDEIGLLPLFLTLILPIVIGVIVLLKCVYTQCCLRKANTKSYTVKPTLKSWKETREEEVNTREQENSQRNGAVPEEVHASGSATNTAAVQDHVIPVEVEEVAPVPPRRSGSNQWRRSHPPAAPVQQNSTNGNGAQVNFSGDSQDSRGYTRISVREPLSNIRNQPIRRTDSHYATVSDDSEEMYAAIDGDANYMRIPGDDARHWQERREANSPLPPVPPPISPVLLPGSEGVATPASSTGPSSSSEAFTPIQPPIYAAVAKVKKNKAPIPPNPIVSNTSTSSSHTATPLPIPPEPPSSTPPPAPSASSKKRSHHNSAILDPPDIPPESRRWSKSDISYSEFEVVRESPFSLSSNPIPPTVELIDEDNYNLIPDIRTRTSSRLSRSTDNSSAVPGTSRTLPHPNRNISNEYHPYAEIKKPKNPPIPISHPTHEGTNHGYAKVKKQKSTNEARDPHHPYSEITKGRSRSRSPTGYYQEIGETKRPIKKRDNLYQKIGRKGGGDDSEDEDEDEEDQLYEKVEAKPSSSEVNNSSGLPANSNPSALKHGYEKIKPKNSKGTDGPALPPQPQPPLPPPVIESDEDGSSMYEMVKYPPYERLKESQDTLAGVEDEESPGNNLYEDIGYSRIKKSSGTNKSSQNQEVTDGGALSSSAQASSSAPVPAPLDLDNLYARVDMSKKKRKETGTSSSKHEARVEYF